MTLRSRRRRSKKARKQKRAKSRKHGLVVFLSGAPGHPVAYPVRHDGDTFEEDCAYPFPMIFSVKARQAADGADSVHRTH